MSIQTVSAYKVGELFFPTIQEAQREELAVLLGGGTTLNQGELETVKSIVDHTDEIVAILTCAPKSKKPRSDKGKKRSPKAPATGAV